MKANRRIVRAGLFLMLIPLLSTSIVFAHLFQTITYVDGKAALEARKSEDNDISLPEHDNTKPQGEHDMLFPGDDGEGKRGITSLDHDKDGIAEENSAPVALQFKDNEDGTVTDSQTALMFTQDANLLGDTIPVHQALDYVEGMNRGNYQNFGYTDWRLPSMRELQSLIDYTEYQKGGHTLPSGHPFHNVQSLRFNDRSRDTYLTTSTHRWFILFYCSIFGRNSRYCQGYLWPVRTVHTISSTPDTDEDNVPDTVDNCPSVYNPNQEDTYPLHGNGIGDACDCECDINCDGSVDALDIQLFKKDFQRRTKLHDPCTNENPCNGDFDCDGDVDEDDESLLQGDFGRDMHNNPCPPCVSGNWCSYSGL